MSSINQKFIYKKLKIISKLNVNPQDTPNYYGKTLSPKFVLDKVRVTTRIILFFVYLGNSLCSVDGAKTDNTIDGFRLTTPHICFYY